MKDKRETKREKVKVRKRRVNEGEERVKVREGLREWIEEKRQKEVERKRG